MWATWTIIWIHPFGKLVANGEWATVNFKPRFERGTEVARENKNL
jgi:hypothetical protein